ncbi:MAG: S41 family peptidase [Proteobacteria bacterium]|nr:S41 family peptidase [Pseudomonadota bacterium]
MSLKTRAILVLVVGTAMGLSLSFGGRLLSGEQRSVQVPTSPDQARLLAEVIQRVKSDYVEPIDDSVLMENALRGMLSELDPHSQYLDADEYRDIRISTTGSYTGIGIEVSEVDGKVRVITPIAGSPAARSGIRAGDQIIAVDGNVVEAKRLQDTISGMRGRRGSKITITVLRDDEAIDYEMRRELIRVASVHHENLQPNYGYIRLSQFTDSTAQELSRAVDDLQKTQGGMLNGLVLDLRNNPGGVLDAAIDVSDLFLDTGVIVSAEGRTAESRFVRAAHRGDVLDGAAMVILVNKGSASAAEIVAGALQDHNRATVVGTPTFGKGLVQTVVPLSMGRAIKLTTSRYFTPSGDSIHEIGITPDVLVDDTDGFPDLSLSSGIDRERDAQLIEAIGRLQGRQVMHSSAQ